MIGTMVSLMMLPGSVQAMYVGGRAVAAHDTNAGPVVAVEADQRSRVTTVTAGGTVPEGGTCIGIVTIYGAPAAVYAHP